MRMHKRICEKKCPVCGWNCLKGFWHVSSSDPQERIHKCHNHAWQGRKVLSGYIPEGRGVTGMTRIVIKDPKAIRSIGKALRKEEVETAAYRSDIPGRAYRVDPKTGMPLKLMKRVTKLERIFGGLADCGNREISAIAKAGKMMTQKLVAFVLLQGCLQDADNIRESDPENLVIRTRLLRSLKQICLSLGQKHIPRSPSHRPGVVLSRQTGKQGRRRKEERSRRNKDWRRNAQSQL